MRFPFSAGPRILPALVLSSSLLSLAVAASPALAASGAGNLAAAVETAQVANAGTEQIASFDGKSRVTARQDDGSTPRAKRSPKQGLPTVPHEFDYYAIGP